MLPSHHLSGHIAAEDLEILDDDPVQLGEGRRFVPALVPRRRSPGRMQGAIGQLDGDEHDDRGHRIEVPQVPCAAGEDPLLRLERRIPGERVPGPIQRVLLHTAVAGVLEERGHLPGRRGVRIGVGEDEVQAAAAASPHEVFRLLADGPHHDEVRLGQLLLLPIGRFRRRKVDVESQDTLVDLDPSAPVLDQVHAALDVIARVLLQEVEEDRGRPAEAAVPLIQRGRPEQADGKLSGGPVRVDTMQFDYRPLKGPLLDIVDGTDGLKSQVRDRCREIQELLYLLVFREDARPVETGRVLRTLRLDLAPLTVARRY